MGMAWENFRRGLPWSWFTDGKCVDSTRRPAASSPSSPRGVATTAAATAAAAQVEEEVEPEPEPELPKRTNLVHEVGGAFMGLGR